MTMSDYSDLEKEIESAPEPKILPAGSEVKARIIMVNTGISDKNGCKWYMPVFDVPADPMVMSFSDFFWEILDRDKLEASDYAKALNKFNKFTTAFRIDLSRPFSWTDDLPGKDGWMILGIQKDKEGVYDDKNSVKKYIAGK